MTYRLKRRWIVEAAWCIILAARSAAAELISMKLKATDVNVDAVDVCVDASTIVTVLLSFEATGDLRRRGGKENLGVARGVAACVADLGLV